MPRPSLTYRATFLVVGASLAVVSYVVGTWLYTFEHQIWGGPETGLDLWNLTLHIPWHHPLTLFPWVASTTGLAVLVGYLFDRQVQLRTRLEALAVTDGLTLVHNYRYFVQQLSLEIKRTQRQPRNFAVLMLDIDDFKHFNDVHGHLAGDDALRMVAQTIRTSVRDTDIVARYGGEEFVVIAPDADQQQGLNLATRIKERVFESTLVTVSVGVSGFPDDGATVNDLIRAADVALYQAKGSGKNCVRASKSSDLPLIFRDH